MKCYFECRLVTTSVAFLISAGAIQHSSAMLLIPDQSEEQDISSWITGLPLSQAEFGSTVTLFNRDLAIGAPNQITDPTPSGFRFGAAFTLNEMKTNWATDDILSDFEGIAIDDCSYYGDGWELGDSISISATRLAVGGPKKWFEDVTGCITEAGTVYLYQKVFNQPVTWLEIGSLTSPFDADRELYGDAVALTEDFLMVGASGDGNNSPSPGSVYVYDITNLSLVQTLDDAVDTYAGFGSSIAVDRTTDSLMVVGADLPP